MPFVSLMIRFQLRFPKFEFGLRPPSQSAVSTVSMPEAAVYKDYLLSCREHQVWFSRQFTNMQSIPKAHRMDELTDSQLRLRIL